MHVIMIDCHNLQQVFCSINIIGNLNNVKINQRPIHQTISDDMNEQTFIHYDTAESLFKRCQHFGLEICNLEGSDPTFHSFFSIKFQP